MAGQHFSYPQLETLWDRAGGPRNMAPVMAAIAEVESGGDSEPTPGKLGNNPDTATGLPGAVGPWQIEWPLYQGYGGASTPEQMLDPLTNARAAVELAAGDPSTAPGHPIWDNWIQWEHPAGAYRRFLSHPAAPAPPGGLLLPGKVGPFTVPGIGGLNYALIGQAALTAVLVAGGAAAAVIGAARIARSTRRGEQP